MTRMCEIDVLIFLQDSPKPQYIDGLNVVITVLCCCFYQLCSAEAVDSDANRTGAQLSRALL